MKRIVFLTTIFIIGFLGDLISQDLIYKTDGTEINVKVIEISETIKYRNYNQKEGPLRNIKKGDVFMIIYEDGTRELFKSPIPRVSDQDSLVYPSDNISKNSSNSNEDFSIINIYRPKSFTASAVGAHIIINGKFIGILMNGQKLKFKIWGTGSYEITCNELGLANAKYFNKIYIEVQKGKSYYVRINTGNIAKADRPGKHMFEIVGYDIGKIQFDEIADNKLIEVSE